MRVQFFLYAPMILVLLSGCSQESGIDDQSSVGFVDQPVSGTFADDKISLVGWATDEDGLQAVEIVFNDQVFFAEIGLERNDVAAARPELKGAATSGFRFSADLTRQRVGNDSIEVRSVDSLGRRTRLANLGFSQEPAIEDHPGIGFTDQPASGTFANGQVSLVGWATDEDGLQAVEIVFNGQVFPAEIGLERNDVAAVRPELKGVANSGFRFSADLTQGLVGNDSIEVRSVDRRGNRTRLASLGFSGKPPVAPWHSLAERYPQWAEDPFFLAVGTSGLTPAQLQEFDSVYGELQGPTIRFGLRVPILYMRTTKGQAEDWVFDPDFDVAITEDGKTLAEDSLNSVLKLAVEHRTPILLTLNGGVWADARDTAPAWDLNDHLEQDPANCQWTTEGRVFDDDHLKNLPGSEGSPELANSLTFNYYASAVHAYKKRNLQEAVRIIQRFAEKHPELFIGINLDPDVYMNPFFQGKEWFDYNPGTVRQFREWLSATGPYADGEPLAAHRHAPLSLEQVSALATQTYSDWQQVMPPRPGVRYGEDPWFTVWEQFRRHLVDMHYDDLSRWVAEAGIAQSKIFSSQGFTSGAGSSVLPLPVKVLSPAKNYDTAGVSIEGAKPSHGHLGAIVYGEAAKNLIAMENDRNLFSTIQDFDRDWGISEFNLAAIEHPEAMVDYDVAYRALLLISNNNARFLSPMAWNGSNGIFEGQPGYVGYTSWRNTSQEAVFKDLTVLRQGLPRSAKLWPFGLRLNSATDGWVGLDGSQVVAAQHALRIEPRDAVATLLSPEIVLDAGKPQLLLVKLSEPQADMQIEAFWADEAGGHREPLLKLTALKDFQQGEAGLEIPLQGSSNHKRHLLLRFVSSTPLQIEHIALAPL